MQSWIHVIEWRGERGRDRFFDEPLAQSNPQIAGENLHDVLAFAGG